MIHQNGEWRDDRFSELDAAITDAEQRARLRRNRLYGNPHAKQGRKRRADYETPEERRRKYLEARCAEQEYERAKSE